MTSFFVTPILAMILASVVVIEPVTVVFFGLLAWAFTIVVACPLIGFARWKRWSIWPVLVGAVACLAIVSSVLLTQWPLRAAYAVSRPSLERLASDAREGRPSSRPQLAGLFLVERVEINKHGIVCLWTTPNPGGDAGFVQSAPDRLPFNLWSTLKLDDRWQYICED